MPPEELYEWLAWIRIQNERQELAARKAKAEAKRRR